MKKYLYRLLAELFVIVLVPLIFRFIENRLYAGMVAGTVFIVLGFYVIWPGIQTREGRMTLSFWGGCLHLGASAFPLFISRMLQAGTRFEDVKIFGMSGPEFHQFSTGVFTVMLIATALDVAWMFWKSRKAV